MTFLSLTLHNFERLFFPSTKTFARVCAFVCTRAKKPEFKGERH